MWGNVDWERDKGGFEQLGVSQEVSGGVVGYSFKLFVGFRLIEILGLTFLGIERWVTSVFVERPSHFIWIWRCFWSWKDFSFGHILFEGRKLQLEWLRPYVGCFREGACLNEVWARVLGLPMHLWGKDFFKRLDDACGGFIMVNMEIEERCHNPNSGQPMTLTVKGLTVRINLNLSWQSTSRPWFFIFYF